MSKEERRTLTITALALLLASLIRFGWEARPLPPVLPPEPVPPELIEATRQELEREERMRTPLAPGELIDPNRDPDVELARLPGIGPALAARMVEDRELSGAFRTPQDLVRVSGVGPATLARIEAYLDLSNPPALAGSSGNPVATGPVGSGPGTRDFAGIAGGAAGAVNINSAGPAELQQLPGIGPALADRIVAHRAASGPFSQPEQLLEVPGIGPASLERLLPLVRTTP
jgi:competence protein ComEA